MRDRQRLRDLERLLEIREMERHLARAALAQARAVEVRREEEENTALERATATQSDWTSRATNGPFDPSLLQSFSLRLQQDDTALEDAAGQRNEAARRRGECSDQSAMSEARVALASRLADRTRRRLTKKRLEQAGRALEERFLQRWVRP